MAEFGVKPVKTDCPYCGEGIELLIDCSQEEQEYIEDCQVCCRPMNVRAAVDENGSPSVRVSHEDEA